jgi:ribosomal protein S18 acetylase RimI-like enzyme
MGVIIRAYQQRDLNAVARLWLESWRSTGLSVARLATEAANKERMARELTSGWSVNLACNENDAPLGFLALKPKSGCLDQLFVATAAPRQGIGRALIEFAKQRMPNGIWLRTAVDNDAACRFYEREGFRRCETGVHPTLGLRTVIYRWP